jgi:hypothetical protein
MWQVYRAQAGLWLILLAMPASVAGFADDQVQQGTPLAALNRLNLSIQKAGSGVAAPALGNAQADLVRTAFDLQAMRSMLLDSDVIIRTCDAIGNAQYNYVQYTDRAATPSSDSSAIIAGLHDEVALGAAASNLCVQRGLHALVAAVAAPARVDEVRLTFKRIQQSAYRTLNGTLSVLKRDGMTAANRSMMLSAMLEDAPIVASSLSTGNRMAVQERATGMLSGASSSDRKQLEAIVGIFARPDCNELCGVANNLAEHTR